MDVAENSSKTTSRWCKVVNYCKQFLQTPPPPPPPPIYTALNCNDTTPSALFFKVCFIFRNVFYSKYPEGIIAMFLFVLLKHTINFFVCFIVRSTKFLFVSLKAQVYCSSSLEVEIIAMFLFCRFKAQMKLFCLFLCSSFEHIIFVS